MAQLEDKGAIERVVSVGGGNDMVIFANGHRTLVDKGQGYENLAAAMRFFGTKAGRDALERIMELETALAAEIVKNQELSLSLQATKALISEVF